MVAFIKNDYDIAIYLLNFISKTLLLNTNNNADEINIIIDIIKLL